MSEVESNYWGLIFFYLEIDLVYLHQKIIEMIEKTQQTTSLAMMI